MKTFLGGVNCSLFPVSMLAIASLWLAGCVVEERTVVRGTVRTAPAPVIVETVVVDAPPPPREEVILVRPSPAHVWIRGYWSWREGRHVWIEGRWELPPRAGVVWVEPRWERRDRGYVFIAGSWREGGVTVRERAAVADVSVTVRVVAQPPPPPRREILVERERPSDAHVWIKGYWVWREGRHVWIGGHWERPPRPHAIWVEPRWEHRREGFVFIEGFWKS